jgi:eukaryotic-like serine/threonine-protein kinase
MAEIPASIGKYRITQLVAQGGMGAVYKGIHPTLKRNVILKKLTARGSPQFIERFKREARIMMDFKHDGIVTVYDHFKEGSSYYIVLEYVDGLSLDELIQRRRSLPNELGLYVFLQVCLALKYAHDSGVIHRDIKPSNILISRKGEVKLVDFGIAGYEEERDEALTAPGMTLGTLAYMPPEQFKNTRNVDKCADIYAMGVMLYEMATGKKPFPGNFSPETIVTIQKGKYIHVRRLNPRIDRVFALLIGKMVRPKKERRYQDLAPVIRILRRRLRRREPEELQKRLVAAVNGVEYKAPARKGRRLLRALVAIVLPLLVLLSAAGAWLYFGGKYFEWLRPFEYGKLKVDARFGAGERPGDHPVSALLLARHPEAGGSAGPGARTTKLPMPGAAAALLAKASAGADKALVSSGYVYLKSGDYILQMTIGEKQYSEAFYLPPFRTQEAEGRPRGMELSYAYAGHEPKPLSLSFKVLDERMRQDITDIAAVSVKSSFGIWFELGDMPRQELVSGRSYLLRVSAPGYESEELSVSVGPLQTQAFFQASLSPIAGRLSIVSGLEGLRLTINGMGAVASGDASRKLQPLRLTEKRPLSLSLRPGAIRIEVSGGGRHGSEELTIESGAERNLIVKAGPGPTSLVFKELE